MRKIVMWTGFVALLALVSVVPGYSQGPPDFALAIAAQQAHTDRLLAQPGVVGTAVGLGSGGSPVVLILTESSRVTALPASLNGVPTRVMVTGRLYAIHHMCGHDKPTPYTGECPPPDPGGGGGGGTTDCASTTEKCRPARIGQSSGTDRLITVNGTLYCTTGTLGARMSGGGVYALSNAHVYALEGSEPAGGPVTTSDPILQPGRVDMTEQSCGSVSEREGARIGTLAWWVPIQFDNSTTCTSTNLATCNYVDAAIAGTTTANVGTGTLGDGYGQPKQTVLDVTVANLGMRVQKYGRTTGLTKGSLQGVNGTVNICYDTGCAKFVEQLIIDGGKGGFIKGGDSGSLLVAAGGSDDRKPIGLLFAGGLGGKTGIANRIARVLSEFPGVQIDGEP